MAGWAELVSARPSPVLVPADPAVVATFWLLVAVTRTPSFVATSAATVRYVAFVAPARTAQPVEVAVVAATGQRTHWYLYVCVRLPADAQSPGSAVSVEASVSVPEIDGASVLAGVESTGPSWFE